MPSKKFALGLALLACISLGLQGCGSSDGDAEVVPTLQWSARADQDGQSATLQVPMNPLDDASAQITLALRRYPASGTKQGSIVLNPGGPGASAVDYLDAFVESSLGQRLRTRFDLVAFDPRGVGHSTQVRCVDDPLPYLAIDKNPYTAFEYQSMVATIQDYAAQCAAKNGALLAHIRTTDVVRDMERIRQALGEGPLNYIGLSYGTKIGALYANTYPQNVRAMVLDGVLPPSVTLQELAWGQIEGFEQSLNAFLSACAPDRACGFGNGQPEQALTALLAQLKQQPLPAGNNQMLTYGAAHYGLMLGMYSEDWWPWLQEALAAAQAGDGRALLDMAQSYFGRNPDGIYPNLADANNAVHCSDLAAPSATEIQAAVAVVSAKYPVFGPIFMNDMLYCSYWPVALPQPPKTVRAVGAPPIMVVGNTGDPATPYAWAQRLVAELDAAFLVTFRSEMHTAAGASTCVDARYEQYLLSPRAGFADLTCEMDAPHRTAMQSSTGPRPVKVSTRSSRLPMSPP